MKNFINSAYTHISRIAIVFALSVFFIQCKKDTPEEINEEEVINRVTLTVTAADGSSNDYTWNQGDAIPTIPLAANTISNVSVHFYDASDASDIEDITEEVIEEADEHFVFYQISSASLSISAASNDVVDADGISINLKTEWTAAAASSGAVRVYLIHEPTSKTGASRGELGGSTDVELDFPVSIQ
jgi:hypothetical protein